MRKETIHFSTTWTALGWCKLLFWSFSFPQFVSLEKSMNKEPVVLHTPSEIIFGADDRVPRAVEQAVQFRSLATYGALSNLFSRIFWVALVGPYIDSGMLSDHSVMFAWNISNKSCLMAYASKMGVPLSISTDNVVVKTIVGYLWILFELARIRKPTAISWSNHDCTKIAVQNIKIRLL